MKVGISKIAKQIILDELQEQSHPELVEDVIFWALEYYAKNKSESTFGKAIAYSIVERIKQKELNYQKSNN